MHLLVVLVDTKISSFSGVCKLQSAINKVESFSVLHKDHSEQNVFWLASSVRNLFTCPWKYKFFFFFSLLLHELLSTTKVNNQT